MQSAGAFGEMIRLPGAGHSLTRYVKGHKAKDIKAKLADIVPDQLPTVDQAKELQRQRKRAQKAGGLCSVCVAR